MLYIIDANNLAGKMKMLGEADFDKKLAGVIRRFNQRKGRRILLVFDGSDPYGDKQEVGDNVTVVYSPKDKYYQSADDYVVELVEKNIKTKSEIFLVTDDRDLIKRVDKVAETGKREIKIVSAAGLAEKIRLTFRRKEIKEEADENRGLPDSDVDKINRELMDLWK